MRSPSNSSRRWLFAPLFAFALIAAACGDSSDSGGSDDATGGDDASGFAASMPECPVDALETASGPVDVVVWNTATGTTLETLEKLVGDYNASQTKVVVKLESQGASYEEIWNKYQSAAQAGDLPNVAILEDITFQAVAESGTVLPAQACIDAEDYDTSNLVESAIDYYSIDDAFVPGTVQLSTPVVYYNKNHFRRANLDPENAPKTLAEVRDYAQQIKDAGVVDKPVVLYLHPWFIETWLTGAGEPVVNNDNGHGPDETSESLYDNESTVELYTWIKQMYDDGLLNAIPYNPGTIDHYLAVANQSGSMMFETSTAATTIKAFLGGDSNVVEGLDEANVDTSALDPDAGPMPGLAEPGRVQIGGGIWVMALTGTPEQQAATWDFMKWWNSPETQAVWHMEGSYLPFNELAADDPALDAYWSDDLAGQWLAISYDQLVNGTDPDFPGPVMGPFSQARDAMSQSLDRLVLEGQSPADAISQAAQQITAELQQYLDEGF
jgi:sn-glycerol 3-phosphate transport system substrate-binding protein